jgi:F-type H+-transporting ATPase subunit epsilon
MAKVSFRLVMPERELLAAEADMVVVPGSEGDFGVLHGHAPLISTVRPGVLEVLQGNKVEQRFIVVGGFAEVTSERCTVLADEAMPFEQVTAEQLAERERAAERDLTDAATEAEKATARRDLAVAKDLRRAQAYYASR